MTTLSLRPAYLWLLLVPLMFLMDLAGQRVETAGVALGGVLALAAAVLPRHRTTLSISAAVMLLSLVSGLGLHLLNDDFHYRYVWLYSAAEMTPYFKIANIWGGEEGTLLFCAALFAVTALALNRYGGWASACQLVFTAFFAFAAVSWDPFQPTAEPVMSGRGMNVHLTKVWMTLHPPLILIAYALSCWHPPAPRCRHWRRVRVRRGRRSLTGMPGPAGGC